PRFEFFLKRWILSLRCESISPRIDIGLHPSGLVVETAVHNDLLHGSKRFFGSVAARIDFNVPIPRLNQSPFSTNSRPFWKNSNWSGKVHVRKLVVAVTE